MTCCEIQLEILTQGKVSMLSGHDRGLKAREHFNIEKLEQECEKITIISGENLDAITPSFVQGFWATSNNLSKGREEFLAKYQFDAPDFIRDDFLAGLDRLLMTRSIATK